MTVTSGTVYVDTDHGGTESGTITEPFNTMTEGEGHFAGTCDGACIILCRGDTLDTANVAVNFDNLGNTMTIKAARDADWSGVDDGFYSGSLVWNASFYILNNASSFECLDISTGDIIIDGLQLESTQSHASARAILVNSASSDLTVKNCRITGTGVSGRLVFPATSTATETITFHSNICFDCSGDGLTFGGHNGATKTINVFGNTIFDCGVGLLVGTDRAGYTYNFKNNNFYNNGPDMTVLEVNATVNHDFNAGQDAPPTDETNGVTLGTLDDEMVTPEGTMKSRDVNPEASGSGLDVAGTTGGPSEDIIGNTRHATTPTIGAWELVAAGPAPVVPGPLIIGGI